LRVCVIIVVNLKLGVGIRVTAAIVMIWQRFSGHRNTA
jgi:hypothetical protein